MIHVKVEVSKSGGVAIYASIVGEIKSLSSRSRIKLRAGSIKRDDNNQIALLWTGRFLMLASCCWSLYREHAFYHLVVIQMSLGDLHHPCSWRHSDFVRSGEAKSDIGDGFELNRYFARSELADQLDILPLMGSTHLFG